jgi:hypothetical protein
LFEAADVGGVREERATFDFRDHERLIMRLGPLQRSAVIVIILFALLGGASLIRPSADGFGWISNSFAPLFKGEKTK